jgi:hypothetical protein
MGRVTFVLVTLALGGCKGAIEIPPQQQPTVTTTTNVEGPQAPAIIERDTGETPAICYVRARNFQGLVPLSCNEAGIIRP